MSLEPDCDSEGEGCWTSHLTELISPPTLIHIADTTNFVRQDILCLCMGQGKLKNQVIASAKFGKISSALGKMHFPVTIDECRINGNGLPRQSM